MAKTTAKKQDEITYDEVKADTEANMVKEAKAEKSEEANQSQQKQDKDANVITHPADVAALVMSQMNNVNNKKDELTIAIKTLTDTTSQLVNAYANNMKIIQELSRRVKDLEGKS